MSRNLEQASATGDVEAGPVYLHSAILTGGSAASTVDVRDGSGGAVKLTLKAAAGESAPWTSGDPKGVLFSTAIHATLAGAGALASFEYS